MALFTDGPASSIEDLTAQDSQLLAVASSEGIDLTVKLGLTQEMTGMELTELLRRASRFGPEQVVVTPPLRLWHTYRTLENVYRDAYNSQLNDRYAGKREQFRELSKWAYDRLVQAGIGIAAQAVPRAAPPVLRAVAGEMPDGLYYVTMAWVNAAGEEGAPATAGTILLSGSGLEASPPAPPPRASGWNVFVGNGPDTMARQNNAPIDPAMAWTQAEPLHPGAAPGNGQAANYFHAIPRVIQRG